MGRDGRHPLSKSNQTIDRPIIGPSSQTEEVYSLMGVYCGIGRVVEIWIMFYLSRWEVYGAGITCIETVGLVQNIIAQCFYRPVSLSDLKNFPHW